MQSYRKGLHAWEIGRRHQALRRMLQLGEIRDSFLLEKCKRHMITPMTTLDLLLLYNMTCHITRCLPEIKNRGRLLEEEGVRSGGSI